MNWTTAEVLLLYFWGMLWGILIGNPFWRIVRSLNKPIEKLKNEQIDYEESLDHEQTIGDARHAGCP